MENNTDEVVNPDSPAPETPADPLADMSAFQDPNATADPAPPDLGLEQNILDAPATEEAAPTEAVPEETPIPTEEAPPSITEEAPIAEAVPSANENAALLPTLVILARVPNELIAAVEQAFNADDYGIALDAIPDQLTRGMLQIPNVPKWAELMLALRNAGLFPSIQLIWPNISNAENPAANVLLLTLAESHNYNILQVLDPLTAHRSMARRFFHNIEASQHLEKSIGKSSSNPFPPSNQAEKIFHAIFDELRAAAVQAGANAVIGLQVNTFTERTNLDTDNDQIRILVTGSAVILEKI